MLYGPGQLRENCLIQQLCELRQIAGRIRLVTNKGAGGRLYSIAPDVGLDQLDDELDLPLYLPQFMEAATFSIHPLRLSPLDTDESQLVQQATAGAVSIVAQVQVQLRAFWRRRRCFASRSRCRGTAGVPAGTSPSLSPISSRSRISCIGSTFPLHNTVCMSSCSSASPGIGKSRIAASASLSRTASITLAEEASNPFPRSRCAAWVIQRIVTRSGAVQRCSYQPGEVTPAP